MNSRRYKKCLISASLLCLISTSQTYAHKNVIIKNVPLIDLKEEINKEEINKQIEQEKIEENTNKYTAEDLDLLTRVINAEMGCDWFPDKLLEYTGSVILNRVSNQNYPNAIKDVVYQKGQYQCVRNGGINKNPSERHYNIAKKLLENGSVIPKNIIYQAEFPQGSGTFYKYYDKILKTTIYFCYE